MALKKVARTDGWRTRRKGARPTPAPWIYNAGTDTYTLTPGSSATTDADFVASGNDRTFTTGVARTGRTVHMGALTVIR